MQKWIEEIWSNSLKVYIPVIFISILGGIVRLLNNEEEGDIKIRQFLKEILTSLFCGLISFLLLKETNKISYSIIIAISGWISYKSISWLNSILDKKISKIFGSFFSKNNNGK